MIPVPSKPHLILRHVSKTEPIMRNQKTLNSGGTSVGVAMQLAYVMGASEIHLYGVEFSNVKGNNYFYNVQTGETGATPEDKMRRMDEMIVEIISQGTQVFSHGFTNLKNSIKV